MSLRALTTCSAFQVCGADSSAWLQTARADTPGCTNVAHFNNAGAALQPQPVIDAVHSYLQEEQQWGGYEAVARCTDDLEKPYAALASLLNCRPDEVRPVG